MSAKSRTVMGINGPVTVVETKDTSNSFVGLTVQENVSVAPIVPLIKGGALAMMGVG